MYVTVSELTLHIKNTSLSNKQIRLFEMFLIFQETFKELRN